ncbi:MAG: YhcB family protein [Candidatus Margulisbacteria bacterium]|nr:YhcB family protein [Candidatus Margulisiibacteriota bacterium]MBU1021637.1 YhcB family protein [Candidatus Margulisiibacteriota bacterium]MBU1728787.1 YhcB family protein [Candidatus Margulisiibacteriota bacterium]MBU1955753.1 YhcB family protein [Candidatus Margulisiibacteriota bacterium]
MFDLSPFEISLLVLAAIGLLGAFYFLMRGIKAKSDRKLRLIAKRARSEAKIEKYREHIQDNIDQTKAKLQDQINQSKRQ